MVMREPVYPKMPKCVTSPEGEVTSRKDILSQVGDDTHTYQWVRIRSEGLTMGDTYEYEQNSSCKAKEEARKSCGCGHGGACGRRGRNGDNGESGQPLPI
jgi:hypothetical protein